MAFEGNHSMDMSAVLTPRFLDFSTVGAPPQTGEVSMDLTQALGVLSAAAQVAAPAPVHAAPPKTEEMTTGVHMALTEALSGNIKVAEPIAVESIPAATAAAALPVVAPSPAPFATPGNHPLSPFFHLLIFQLGRAGVRQLTAEEFYLRAAVRFLPVDAAAAPHMNASSTTGESFHAAPTVAQTAFDAAVTMNSVSVYEEAAADLAGPVIGTS